MNYKVSIILLSLLVVFSTTLPNLMASAQTAPSNNVATTDQTVSFTAPAVNTGQVKLLRFGLSVSDAHGGVDQTSINIIVIHVNSPPIINVNTPLTVDEGTQVTLSGSATDPDNDKLSY